MVYIIGLKSRFFFFLTTITLLLSDFYCDFRAKATHKVPIKPHNLKPAQSSHAINQPTKDALSSQLPFRPCGPPPRLHRSNPFPTPIQHTIRLRSLSNRLLLRLLPQRDPPLRLRRRLLSRRPHQRTMYTPRASMQSILQHDRRHNQQSQQPRRHVQPNTTRTLHRAKRRLQLCGTGPECPRRRLGRTSAVWRVWFHADVWTEWGGPEWMVCLPVGGPGRVAVSGSCEG